MNTLEAAEISLVIAFLEILLENQSDAESLEAQNLSWSIRVLNDRFLRERKK